jgi:diaminohydroxyphosphoribosylaminopyrimidine deaminase/5-amino-6-(5-phosphoribosylamino)uracil reductase
VAGRGLQRLRQAGIEVARGSMADAAHWMAAGHILRVTERRPFVQAKLALAADGSVPRGGGGKPAWATSLPSRALGHLMRARADAVLVGRRTVIDDDPLLTCRAGLGALAGAYRAGPNWTASALATVERRAGIRCGYFAEGADAWRWPLGRAFSVPSRWAGHMAAEYNGDARRARHHAVGRGRPATWGAFSQAALIDGGSNAGAPSGGKAFGRRCDCCAATLHSGRHLYDRRTIGSDDMLAIRRRWLRAGRPGGSHMQ